jgi:hypothetical protein
MCDGDPCPDCPWTTYLLSGRPILFMRCNACRNWFHCNIKVKTPSKNVAGGTTVEATLNLEATRGMVYSLLRCDCLAPQIFLTYIANCDSCCELSLGLVALMGYTLTLTHPHTLHSLIRGLTISTYGELGLPAYTLQRRCGAVEAYLQRYITMVAEPLQASRAVDYRRKRLEIRNAKTACED